MAQCSNLDFTKTPTYAYLRLAKSTICSEFGICNSSWVVGSRNVAILVKMTLNQKVLRSDSANLDLKEKYFFFKQGCKKDSKLSER